MKNMDRYAMTALLLVALTMVFVECHALSTMHDQDGSSLASVTNVVNVAPTENKNRQLQFVNGNTCGVTGFSVYNSFKSAWEPLPSVVINDLPHAQVVLDTYHPMQAINIQTNIDLSGCAAMGRPSTIGCARMKLFNNTYFYDYGAPYTLYPPVANQVGTTKPARLGFQYFAVELFENATCDGTLICDDKLNLHFVNRPIEFRSLDRFRATYHGLQSTPSTTLGNRLADATCAYVKHAIKYGFLVAGSSLGFSDIGWKCNTMNTTSSPPAMSYNFNVNFTISSMISIYDNSDPPTVANITSYIKGLFSNAIPGAGYTETMMQYLKKPSTGLTTNPYWNYTSITLS
jgi:hypothetical protein